MKSLLSFFTSSIVLFTASSAAEPTSGEKLFALKVKPLFTSRCLSCHGEEGKKIKGGFDMRTLEAVLKGGDEFEEQVLFPGDPSKSHLYLVTTRTVEDYEMPPKEADKLSREESWVIRDWIKAGAPWPDDQRVEEIQKNYAEGDRVATSKALNEDWQNRRYEFEKLWAYRSLKKSSIPEGTHPIDHFINRSLSGKNLPPAPAAHPRELARRLSFGLTGLPPSPKDLAQFEIDFKKSASEAVTQFSQRLMASPHYGEHFARHWLDVSRYADSAGFANDYYRPHAWRYRDYVVRSFNQDKPYPDFVREQLAGDEMDEPTSASLIATGFLRMGPWEQTTMSVFKETRQFWLDDVTDSVGQTFLAHAMQCAKCHDHKFDPIPTRDYYRMMAVFSTTQFAEHDVTFLPSENRTHFKSSQKLLSAKINSYKKQQTQIRQKIKSKRKTETGKAKVGDNGLDPGDEASKARLSKNMERHAIEGDRTKPFAHGVYTGKTIHRNNLKGRIQPAANPWHGPEQIEKDAILTGGNVYAIGDPVTPGALSAAESLGGMKPVKFPGNKGKRRLALANWIVDEKNPLTARVIVNRVWSWHFGQGLAGNPNNFGGTGAIPTHPELLDFLAHWFIKNAWSIKKLNQLITSSETYQRSSRHPDPTLFKKTDPGQKLYAIFIPRRLTAEELRDAMLVASGELNPEIGGLPARPDINLEVARQPLQIMGGTASVYEPDPLPKQRNRRSLYAEKLRGLRDPFFETFNQPGSTNSCESREISTVAPQALTLINAQEMQDRSLAFAHRLIQESNSDPQTITRAFNLALGRPPSPDELSTCLTAWKNAAEEESKLQPKPSTFPSLIKRTIRAEKTGQLYTFEEHLPVFKTYQPDLQRSDTDARTRALSHLCLVIFNLNEFSYLD
ncbi:MAG: PSD1 and planctomycete cytochrome C domain-containing protein [Akkermansiaceae bacterium]|nr:PSD1 and planctomycete cytochrome C domain-containing protein [Akkermansiaceae bacterium]